MQSGKVLLHFVQLMHQEVNTQGNVSWGMNAHLQAYLQICVTDQDVMSHPFIQLFLHPFIPLFIHPPIHPHSHPLIKLFIHPTHSFVNLSFMMGSHSKGRELSSANVL